MPRARPPANTAVAKKANSTGSKSSGAPSSSSAARGGAALEAAESPPSWPPFKPALPVTDITPEQLEASPDKIVLLRNFWPRSLCRDYVAFLRQLPLVTTPGRPRRGEAVRVNDRFQIDDAAFADRLWNQTGLRQALTDDCPEQIKALWYVSSSDLPSLPPPTTRAGFQGLWCPPMFLACLWSGGRSR